MPSPRTDLRDELADVLLSHLFETEDDYAVRCSCGYATAEPHIAAHVAEQVLIRLDQLAELHDPGLLEICKAA